MSKIRRPGQPDEAASAPPHPRRPHDTESALDEVVGSAAEEVERRLSEEGLARPIATPRDILRSRYPRDTVDDEAITEQMAEPLGLGGPRPPPSSRTLGQDPGRARSLAPPTPTASSLSPLAVGPRSARTTGTSSMPPRPSAHARNAARYGLNARGEPRTFFSRAPSAPWILMLIGLGGVTAFTAVVAARMPGFMDPVPSTPPRAAAAGPAIPLVDAGVTAKADAAATRAPR